SPRASLKTALDLFVYAPVGLVATRPKDWADEELDELAKRGRGILGQLLNNARAIGHLSLSAGSRTINDGPEELEEPSEPTTAAVVRPASTLEQAPGPPVARGVGIEGYEALSASQVVRRLDGLARDELEALYRFELATRHRRTILHRARQLLGVEDAPGAP
ncbi:MAG: hypothetical protein ACRD0B_11145, partial [Acidimicrobiales bacterium]